MGINAQRTIWSDGRVTYSTGNYFCTGITLEQYKEVLSETGSEYKIRENAYIIYDSKISKQTQARLAKLVLESENHKNKNVDDYEKRIKELERKTNDLKLELKHLKELQEIASFKEMM